VDGRHTRRSRYFMRPDADTDIHLAAIVRGVTRHSETHPLAISSTRHRRKIITEHHELVAAEKPCDVASTRATWRCRRRTCAGARDVDQQPVGGGSPGRGAEAGLTHLDGRRRKEEQTTVGRARRRRSERGRVAISRTASGWKALSRREALVRRPALPPLFFFSVVSRQRELVRKRDFRRDLAVSKVG